MDNTRGIQLVILYSGLIGILQGIQRFLVPIALLNYGWELRDFAIVFAFQAMSMALPFLLAGLISDLRGRRQTVGIGFLSFSIGSVLMLYSISGDSILFIVLAQMLITMSSGLAQVGLSTLMVDITSNGQLRTESMGRSAGLKSFASFIGPIVMGFLISDNINRSSILEFSFFGYSPLESGFISIGFLGLLGISAILILPATSKKDLEENRLASLSDLKPNQRRMQGAFLIQEILIGFTSGAIVPFIDYYILTKFKPDEFTWGIIFGLSNSTIALGSILVGRYSEGMGKGITIVRLNALAPFLALGIALSPTLIGVASFYILRSGVANSVHPAWESWYFSHTMNSARGRSFSVIQISRRLARGGGVAIGPALFTLMGALSFPLSSIFYPLAMIIPYSTEIRLVEE